MGKNTFNTFGLRAQAKPQQPTGIAKWEDLKKELENLNEQNQELESQPKEPKKTKRRRRRYSDDDEDDDDEPPQKDEEKPVSAPDEGAPRKRERSRSPPQPRETTPKAPRQSQGLTQWPPSRPPSAYNLVRRRSADNLYAKTPGAYPPPIDSMPMVLSEPAAVESGEDPLVAWITNGRKEDVGQSPNVVVLPDQFGNFPQTNVKLLPPVVDSYGHKLLQKRKAAEAALMEKQRGTGQFKGTWLAQNPLGSNDEDAEWRRWLFNGVDDSHRVDGILKFPPIKIGSVNNPVKRNRR